MRPRVESVPGDGYDAGEGPDGAGLASESVDLSEILENAEADSDPLAVAPEDLGRRALREAAQQDEPAALDASFLDEEESLEARTLLDTDDSDVDSPGESIMERAAVDLTDDSIQNGSIFDQPRSGEMGQVRRPLIKTNEIDETLERNERARRAIRNHRGRK
jgi:hypothetical protein